MKLGIPGDYAGGAIGPFGGSVSLTGDINNPAAYRIVSTAWGPDDYLCLWPSGMQFEVMGITFVQNYNGPLRSIGLSVTGGSAIVHDCRFETLAPNNNGCFIQLYNAQFSGRKGNIHFEGNNNLVNSIFYMQQGAGVAGAFLFVGEVCNYYFTNCNANVSFRIDTLSTMTWGGNVNLFNTNCVGQKHGVSNNSVLYMGGKAEPGSTAGSVATGGQFTP